MDKKASNITGKMLVERLSQLEALAEEILADKEHIKEIDRKRNTNREALTAIKKCKDMDSKKSWMCLGGMFIKYPTNNISETLTKDQEALDREMERVRTQLKDKVSELQELEGKHQLKGFSLTALGKEELSSFTVQKS